MPSSQERLKEELHKWVIHKDRVRLFFLNAQAENRSQKQRRDSQRQAERKKEEVFELICSSSSSKETERSRGIQSIRRLPAGLSDGK